MLQLFERYGDEYAANSLGYIYYSDRLGQPDYEKAFFYFSYAAARHVTEAIYKLSDLYRNGHGVNRDPDKAWSILSELYDSCDKKHVARGKYPDIALRMGYCYRDGIGVPKDDEKALSFFLKAKKGIELRIKKDEGFGDETVLKNVRAALHSVTK